MSAHLEYSTGMCCSTLINVHTCLIHCLINIVYCSQFSGKPTLFYFAQCLPPNKVTRNTAFKSTSAAKAKFYETINIHTNNLKV